MKFKKILAGIAAAAVLGACSGTCISALAENSGAKNLVDNVNNETMSEPLVEYDESDSVTYNGVKYSCYTSHIYTDNGEIELYLATVVGFADDRSDINIVDYIYGHEVISISKEAFKGNTNVKTVTIGTALDYIGSYAFSGCTSLETVIIPYVKSINEGCFGGCTSLVDCELPNGLETIGTNAFNGCSSIKKFVIPDSVTSIGNLWGAFSNCTALEEVVIGNGIETIPTWTFSDDPNLKSVTFGENIKTIDTGAFENCTSLDNVKLPQGIESINGSAFYNCTSLTNINLPDSLSGIGESAFKQCTELKSVNIPGGVKTIGKNAFRDCTSLEKADLSYGIETIGYAAFSGCTSLKEIKLPYSVTTLSDNSFENTKSVESITLSPNITNIPFSCFYGSGVCDLTIPNGIENIGKYAFKNCTNLEEVIIPDSVTELGYQSFAGCSGLKKVTIGKNVADKNALQFTDSDNIEELTLLSDEFGLNRIWNDAWDRSKLKSITVSETNPDYSSADGILYSKDGTQLVIFPSAKETDDGVFVVPDNVTSLADYSFYNISGINSVVAYDNDDRTFSFTSYIFESYKPEDYPTKTLYINSERNPNVTSDWTINNPNVSSEKKWANGVDLTLTADIPGISYSWEIDDGSGWREIGSSKELELSCTSESYGNYSFRYTVTLGNGVDVKSSTVKIKLLEPSKVTEDMVNEMNVAQCVQFVNYFTSLQSDDTFVLTNAQLLAIERVLENDYAV